MQASHSHHWTQIFSQTALVNCLKRELPQRYEIALCLGMLVIMRLVLSTA